MSGTNEVVIVDYGMANLRSVQKAFEKVGTAAVISSDPNRVHEAAKVVLPGVGAFQDAIAKLRVLRHQLFEEGYREAEDDAGAERLHTGSPRLVQEKGAFAKEIAHPQVTERALFAEDPRSPLGDDVHRAGRVALPDEERAQGHLEPFQPGRQRGQRLPGQLRKARMHAQEVRKQPLP